MVWPVGAPSLVGSSESEYWVFATQTGSLSPPRAAISLSAFSAEAVLRTRQIQKRLAGVTSLPDSEASALIDGGDPVEE